MGWIDEWIGRRGGGLCMVGGPNSFGSGRWADTPVGRMLPVEVESGGGDWDDVARRDPADRRRGDPPALAHRRRRRGRTARSSRPCRTSSATTGSARPSRRPRSWPGSARARPTASRPLAVQPYGRGRTMAMATGITRRFAAEFTQSWGQGDARYYKKFWRNAVYWLTENSSIGRRRLLAETDKRLYRPGEPIVLQARAFDENAAPTLDYRVAVSIEPRSAAESTSDNSPLRKPVGRPDARRRPGAARSPGARSSTWPSSPPRRRTPPPCRSPTARTCRPASR